MRLSYLVHELGRDDDLVKDWHAAPHEARVAPLGADGYPPLVAVPHDLRHLPRGPRPQEAGGLAPDCPQPVCVVACWLGCSFFLF